MKSDTMKRLTHEQIQRHLLLILQDVDAWCRRHGIRYSLAYGTLLGAVRHKGFIPWDDDVDLLMPRPDFERFVAGYGATAAGSAASTAPATRTRILSTTLPRSTTRQPFPKKAASIIGSASTSTSSRWTENRKTRRSRLPGKGFSARKRTGCACATSRCFPLRRSPS